MRGNGTSRVHLGHLLAVKELHANHATASGHYAVRRKIQMSRKQQMTL